MMNEFIEKAHEKIAKTLTVVRKIIRFAKRRPYLTGFIGLLVVVLLVGIFLFLRAYGGIIMFGLFMLWLSLPPKQYPIMVSGATVAYIVFLATIELYKPLLVRRPKAQKEINEKHISDCRMECYLIKEHPNAPIDSETLDEGCFLLQDKVRHIGADYGCVPTIEAVADEGGYVKITVSWGGRKKADIPTIKAPEAVTNQNDTDF